MLDVAIIGCGIVGASAAFELSRYALDVAVFERENDVSLGTTKANSAIVHAGYDPEPGTLMAELNVEGAALIRTLAPKLDIPYDPCGSLVLAFSDEELETLRELYSRGLANGVPELSLIDGDAARALEPNLSETVTGALVAPTAAIISPWEFCLALAETAVKNGVRLHLNAGVEAIDRIGGGYRLHTAGGVFEARTVLNAAGTHADAVHNMAAPPAFKIRSNRGEYYLLDKSEHGRVSRVIFQCPSALGKGVLLSPTVHGNLIVGPNSVDTDGRDDTSVTPEGLAYVAEHARRSVPSVSLRASIRNFSGVRAQSDRPDFIIEEAEGAPGFIDLAGIKSPGLTSAPAIARRAVDLLGGCGLPLDEKPSFTLSRRRTHFKELTPDEKNALIAKDPAFGRVICRCETVTEGEILEALAGPIPPVSVDGVKRRTGAGLGRCQGGFCGPRIVELLARAQGVSPLDVVQELEGSHILTRETKGGEGA